jgi:omega-amidase
MDRKDLHTFCDHDTPRLALQLLLGLQMRLPPTSSFLTSALRRSPQQRRSPPHYDCRRFAALCWVSSASLLSSTASSASVSGAAAFACATTASSPLSRRAAVSPQRPNNLHLLETRRERIDKSAVSYCRGLSLLSSRVDLRASSSSSARDEMNDDLSSPPPPPETKFRAALCQFMVGEDKPANLQKAKTFIHDAATEHKAQLVVLPEIWNSPYATAAFPQYAEALPSVGDSYRDVNADTQPSSYLLGSMAHRHSLWLVGGSIPEVDSNQDGAPQYYNTCLVYNPDGIVVAKHRKVHLFDIDVPGKIRFVESDTLSPGQSLTTFESPWGIVGIGICYDIRFPEYSQILAQQGGARILVFPGAFNLTTGPLHWELLQRGRAVDNQCWVLTASPARAPSPPTTQEPGASTEAPTTSKYPVYYAWGHSSAVNPWGTVVATTDEHEAIVPVDVDLNDVRDIRGSIPIYDQRRSDLYTSAASIQDTN